MEEEFMNRCIQLAQLGLGNVSPNPMVGALLVHEGKIIGEGHHQKFGGAHAEVNCLNSVKEENRKWIEKSTIYVSLEPCAHFGKTPPCTSLIIEHRIPKVVIGCRDIYKEVDGKGIQQLKDAGIEVVEGVLEKECIELNKRFFTFQQQQRPFIILKWAQSANGKVGALSGDRILISNEYSNRLVHKWRSEEAAILVGRTTVLKDNPSLTTRLWKGKNPMRLVIDPALKIPNSAQIFNEEAGTIIFNFLEDAVNKNIRFIKLERVNFLSSLLKTLYELGIQSVLVEGGPVTHQSFIAAGWWDEARVIMNTELFIEDGIASPELKGAELVKQEDYEKDLISYFNKK
ncbi:MAG: bifunctional diaminohydroxyphosphoribosylaminopyrimidine deaminase/5-amino-6-(5-phosphoribosylamino)uracil reductase RibD [Ginsengibacter sp.]|jgi:diaminohydroxyphosphoribosylaminopyrimidine deaminase/5-amino-6-(5-phosphoribosylamino)uracil reductase